jgi:hypothetical protein
VKQYFIENGVDQGLAAGWARVVRPLAKLVNKKVPRFGLDILSREDMLPVNHLWVASETRVQRVSS